VRGDIKQGGTFIHIALIVAYSFQLAAFCLSVTNVR